MHVLKSNLLARVSLGALAVAAVAAAPVTVQAQTIYGGGATLVSLVLPNLFACYTGNPTTPAQNPPLAVPPLGCSAAPANPGVSFNYDSVGSGAGQRGWVSQARNRFSSALPLNKVSFASSEAALTSGNLGVYANGGRFSSTSGADVARQDDTCVVVTPALGAPASPVAGSTGSDFANVAPTPACNDNPRVEAGPAIQIPFAGVNVTVAFDPVYKRIRNADNSLTEYRYQFTDRGDGSGGLNLSRAAFCGIFAGTISRWNDAQLTADNGGTAVWPDPTDPAAPADTRGRRVEVTVRDDDSGTTSLFTRALRAQCPAQFTAALPSGFSVAFPGNPTPNSIPATASPPQVFNTTCDVNQGNTAFPGTWVYGRGNEGVAFCTDTRAPRRNSPGATAVGGRIAYLSPSFVEPAVNVSPFTTYGLVTADIANSSGNFTAPTTAATELGLGAQPVPADRTDPLAWVANPSGAVAGVSDPTDPGAYPIVGTGNLLLYTCYVDATTAGAFATQGGTLGFLNWLFATSPNAIRNSVTNVLDRQGFTRVPTTLAAAIVETFATTGNANNLFIRPVAGAATAAPDCTVGAG